MAQRLLTYELPSNRIKGGYSGKAYAAVGTTTVDTARRFIATTKFLRDVVVQVETFDLLFGDVTAQTYPVAVGDTLGFTQVDASTLYFKNKTVGEDGKALIFGLED